MIPRFVRIAAASGVSFDPDTQLVSQVGWFLDTNAPGDETKTAAAAAAYFDSDLQMASCRADAFDVQMAGARRVMC